MQLTVLQGHVNDAAEDYFVIFAGRIISAKFSDTELILTCEPIKTTLRRTGLRRHYQYSCPHVLYGSDCRASKLLATTNTTPLSVSGNRVTLPLGWTPQGRETKHVGGMIEWNNSLGDIEQRTILKVLADRNLVVAGSTRDLAPGVPLKVILGCNHYLHLKEDAKEDRLDRVKTDCFALHNNIHNFGGQKFIPTVNPVGRLNLYY